MPQPKLITPTQRKCTMCGDAFTTPRATGRPPAFCTPECKDKARRTQDRLCITCDEQFNIRTTPTPPFYCSPICQLSHPCQKCGEPTQTKFCSHKCVQDVYPPPYPCKVCGHEFFPSEHWLARTASYNGPPKYCSTECFEQRHTYILAKQRPKNPKTAMQWQIAMRAIKGPIKTPYALPLPKGGLPWINMDPVIPQSELHIRSQNTVRFWDYALNNFTEGLTTLEYNAYLFEFVCKRSSPHPKAFELQECWNIWPYVEQYTDERYSTPMFQRFAQNYQLAKRLYSHSTGSMTTAQLNMLVRQCIDAWRIETGPNMQAKAQPRHRKFVEHWLRPMGIQEAPYKNPRNPRQIATYSRIQVELLKASKATSAMGAEWLQMQYLSPLTEEQFGMLLTKHMEIMQFYTDHLEQSKWPWGPRCYDALVKADKPDEFEELKWAMRTTPQYNLPEIRQ